MIILPVFICIDDDDFDLTDGFGKFFFKVLSMCLVTIPITYTTLGYFYGFNAWGIIFVSCLIGFFLSIIPALVWSIKVD